MTIDQLCELAIDHAYAYGWYRQSANEIADVCNRENWSFDRFAAILAVTSPRVSVRRNVRITLHYLHRGELLSNVMGGIRQSINRWELTGRILGPKTSAFNAAICGDESAIVLDTHMASLLGVSQKELSNCGTRERCERIVRTIACLIHRSNAETQAALWTGQLARRGRLALPFPIRQEYYNWRGHNRQFNDGGTIRQLADASGYQTSLAFA